MDKIFISAIIYFSWGIRGLGITTFFVGKTGIPLYGYKSIMETAVLLAIGCIIFITLMFFFLTFYKKVRRIKEMERRQKYQIEIDDLLFKLLFSEKNVREIIESREFLENKDTRIFQQLTIKALIGLHSSYSGIYSLKLEQFFAKSGLAAYSLEKLNSENWSNIVQGIRDLSSLNYLPAYPRIVSYQNHKNKYVKTEVLLGMIKLKGISELLKFQKSEVYYNDWVQSNILFVVKNNNLPAPENLSELLSSKNKSILLLAVRLINYYGLQIHYEKLSAFFQKIEDPKLRKEIILILDKTEQLR